MTMKNSFLRNSKYNFIQILYWGLKRFKFSGLNKIQWVFLMKTIQISFRFYTLNQNETKRLFLSIK